MEQFVYPILLILFTTAINQWFNKRKNAADVKVSQAAAKSAEIDNEIKSADFYEKLNAYTKNRLDELLAVIDEQNKRIAERDKIIAASDIEKRELQKRLAELIDEIEMLTIELRKYKQLKV